MDESGSLKVPPTDDGGRRGLSPIEPGSGQLGVLVARVGNVPLGYYKDPEKSARPSLTFAGRASRSILGDMGTVEADGTIVFLGRGSQCINTGGEVFAEEVEAVLHAIRRLPMPSSCRCPTPVRPAGGRGRQDRRRRG